eukprot:gene7575-11899_t
MTRENTESQPTTPKTKALEKVSNRISTLKTPDRTPKKKTSNPTEKFQNSSQVLSILFKLQETGAEGMDIPEIAIVGPQSSGKSTVLRRIIGIDIIPVKPQGSKVQWTKNPIKVLMNPSEKFKFKWTTDKSKAPESMAFGEHVTDFSKLKKVIFSSYTPSAVEKMKLDEQEIILEISRPGALPLCFVDVPGHVLTPKDERKITESMLKTVFKNKNSIILLANPATIDIQSNNGVFSLMKEEDISIFDRTIGVLTKCDMVDQQELSQLMNNNNGDLKLKLGYIALKNAVDENDINFESQLKEERDFFSKLDQDDVSPDRCGIDNLIKYSTNILEQFVERWFPSAMAKIQDRLEEQLQKKAKLGVPMERNIRDCDKLINSCLQEISDFGFQTNKYGSNAINIKYLEYTKKIQDVSLFNFKEIQESSETESGIYSLKVETVNQYKRSMNKFLPMIKRISYELVDYVFVAAKAIVIEIVGKITSNFSELGTKLIMVLRRFLEEKKKELNTHIEVYVDSYLGFYTPELNKAEDAKRKVEIIEKEIRKSVGIVVPNMINSFYLVSSFKNIQKFFEAKNFENVDGDKIAAYEYLFDFYRENKDTCKKREVNAQDIAKTELQLNLMKELDEAIAYSKNVNSIFQ